MNEYFSTKIKDRQGIINEISKTLSAIDEIIFAYIFGSFLDAPSFRDIDIGVYVKDEPQEKDTDYELNLSMKLSRGQEYSFDVFNITILNHAPEMFLNNVFSRGRLLFSKQPALLSDLIEKTSLIALENEYIAEESLRELIPG